MDTPSDRDSVILERLDRLERENRRLKRLGGGLVLALTLAFACGAATVAQSIFIFCDDDGTSRAVIGVHPQDINNVYFSMADAKKNQFLRMGNDPHNGSYFFILDKADQKRIEFGVDGKNKEYVRLFDADGRLSKQLP